MLGWISCIVVLLASGQAGAEMQVVGTLAKGREIHGVVALDEVVYLSTMYGVEAWNVTNASSPVMLGSSNSPVGRRAVDIGMALHGELLVVTLQLFQTGCCNGLWVLDVANPSAMKNISYVDLGDGGEWNMTVSHPVVVGKTVYVPARGGLDRVDLSDPHHPVVLPRFVPVSGRTVENACTDGVRLYALVAVGTQVYLPSGGGLGLVGELKDTSYLDIDPSAGVLATEVRMNITFYNSTTLAPLSTLETHFTGTDSFSAGGGLLSVGTENSLYVFDYSHPAHPFLRSRHTSSVVDRYAQALLSRAGKLMVAVGSGGAELLTGF